MNLKELRAKHNLTQVALAKSIGVTSNAISAIEGGRLKLSDKLAAKIKEVYGEEPNTPVAEAVVSEAKAVVAKVEKAVEEVAGSAEKKVARKARATKKKVEAEKVTAAAAIPETEKKAEKKTRKVKAKAQADKPAAEMVAEAVVAPVVEAVAAPVKAAAEKKSRKKAPAKKTATAEKKATAKKTPAAPKAPVVILQSPFGGEITAEEILSKVGSVDTVYVRIDQNKAYWVKGEENGEVDLW